MFEKVASTSAALHLPTSCHGCHVCSDSGPWWEFPAREFQYARTVTAHGLVASVFLVRQMAQYTTVTLSCIDISCACAPTHCIYLEQDMLLALRPAHPPMDSFRHNEHDPDRIPGIRNRPARKSPRTSPSLDQQRQLPSFREVRTTILVTKTH